jgi:hypothetical protein
MNNWPLDITTTAEFDSFCQETAERAEVYAKLSNITADEYFVLKSAEGVLSDIEEMQRLKLQLAVAFDYWKRGPKTPEKKPNQEVPEAPSAPKKHRVKK